MVVRKKEMLTELLGRSSIKPIMGLEQTHVSSGTGKINQVAIM
jgi:hypothetical protein